MLQLTSIARPSPPRTYVHYQSTKARYEKHPLEASAVKREAATWMALWKDCASVNQFPRKRPNRPVVECPSALKLD